MGLALKGLEIWTKIFRVLKSEVKRKTALQIEFPKLPFRFTNSYIFHPN